MIETMPGGEQIILEQVPITHYCGTCMVEMRHFNKAMFECPICRLHYKEEVHTLMWNMY